MLNTARKGPDLMILTPSRHKYKAFSLGKYRVETAAHLEMNKITSKHATLSLFVKHEVQKQVPLGGVPFNPSE